MDGKTVLAYPMILFVETVAIAVFLTGFVLPAFSDFFLSMQTELPWPTQLLLDIGALAREDAAGLVAAAVFLFAGGSLLARRPQVHERTAGGFSGRFSAGSVARSSGERRTGRSRCWSRVASRSTRR